MRRIIVGQQQQQQQPGTLMQLRQSLPGRRVTTTRDGQRQQQPQGWRVIHKERNTTDIGSHIISIARYLLGPVSEVMGDQNTVFPTRPVSAGAQDRRPVEVDDMTHALLRFESGAAGSIEANWAAKGRTMDLSFEITGTKGALCFSQERMNELLLYSDDRAKSGYIRIEAGPEHPPYGRFCPAPGHHLGFNDLKIIEVAELLDSHSGAGKPGPDFREAFCVQLAVDAIAKSAKTGVWVAVET